MGNDIEKGQLPSIPYSSNLIIKQYNNFFSIINKCMLKFFKFYQLINNIGSEWQQVNTMRIKYQKEFL